jgi:protein disulfide-isomerase A6
VGVVNCAEDRLCQEHGVQGVPAIKALAPGDKTWTDYNGQRTAGDISAWATALIPNKVDSLRNKSQLQDFLKRCSGGSKLKSKQNAAWGLCVVLVTDKPGTPSLWKALSAVYAGKVAFGLVRSKDAEVVDAVGPNPQVPTVVAICNGDLESREALKGKLKSEPLQQQLGSYALGKKCNSKIRVDATTDLKKLSVSQLKAVLQAKGIACTGCFEKSDFIKALQEGLTSQAAGKVNEEL